MPLPSLKVSLPFIFLCWCLVGYFVHGMVILAYPAMWTVVGLFFYGLHIVLRSGGGAQPAVAPAVAQQPESAATHDDAKTDQQISASV